MTMERVMGALEELKSINAAYGIDTAGISRLQAEMSEARVCTPIIGKFSSGKSALVNTILGYSRKILKEDITPETAIPAEIVYTDSEDVITIIRNDGAYKQFLPRIHIDDDLSRILYLSIPFAVLKFH